MANDGTVKIGTELDDSGFKSGLSKLGSVATTALKGGAAVIGGIGAAASSAVVGLLALESATEEYRIAQGKLNTAFEAAGYGPEVAAQAYDRFYGILGDTDTATEASQLLAKLAKSEEDVATWADIAAGVSGTFGDALPIESLIESANETAKVGEVTGTLADALNWAGISEDEFNAKLAEAGSEAERNQIIMDTLSGTYEGATEAFYRNNEALVASREAQAQMDASLAQLGQTVSDVKARMTAEFLPSISQITTGLAGMLAGTEGADEQFAEGMNALINTAVELLPQFLDFGVQILTSLLNGVLQALPTLVEALPTIITSIVTALQALFPTIIAVGSELLTMLTDGILQYIPEMLVRIPDIITNFYNFLAENGPGIIEKGFEFLRNLVDGIVGAIPEMVAKLPEIIRAWANFVAQNLPTIVSNGIDLLKSLISGIIGAIPDLIAALPQIISAIVDGIGALMDSVIEIGKEIVEGIWEGIKGAKDWVVGKVKGFFGDVVDGAKSFLGIKSPSRLFRDQIGKNIGLGVADGIEAAIPSAEEAMQSLSEAVMDSADAGDMETEFELETDTSGAIETGEELDESMAAGIENGRQGVIDAAVRVAQDAVAAARAVMAEFIPSAAASVAAANSAMSPVAASTPRFTSENALTQAAGMLAMAVSGNASREIVLNLNGKEMARGLISDIRSVESQSPAIQYN